MKSRSSKDEEDKKPQGKKNSSEETNGIVQLTRNVLKEKRMLEEEKVTMPLENKELAPHFKKNLKDPQKQEETSKKIYKIYFNRTAD